MAQSLEQLAYELSVASISQQQARETELRSRTGILLAAAAVTASFFSARAAVLDPAAFLALVAYAASAVAGLVVLLPHRLVMEFHGSTLLHRARGSGASLDEAHEAAAAWIERFHERNRDVLMRLARWYTGALAFVGLEVVLWTVSVSGIL